MCNEATRTLDKDLTIIIVDDNATFRSHAAWFLESRPGFSVAGVAATAGDGVREVGRLRPDVVLLDVSLPDQSGLAVIGAMKQTYSDVRVIMLTSHDESEYRARAVELGADGYVVKKDMARDLASQLEALR